MSDDRPRDGEPTEDEEFWTDRSNEPVDPPFWTGFSTDEPPDEEQWPPAGESVGSFEEATTVEVENEPPTVTHKPPTLRYEREEPEGYEPKPSTEPLPEADALPSIDELTFTPRAEEPEPAERRAPRPDQVVYTPPRSFRPRSLSKRNAATLAAFGEALLPHGGPIAPSASDVDAPERLDAAMERWDPQARKRFARALSFFEWQSLLTRSMKRFSKLKPDDAVASLARAASSRSIARRGTVELLKFYVANSWASAPEVESAIGFDYGCLSSDPPRETEPLEVLQYPQVSRDHVEDCDVVVVGSGAGGAVVAKEMAELGMSVIVLEEGGSYSRRDFTGPPFERFMRFYRLSGMTHTVGSPPIPLPMGIAVGGSTLINSGTAFRTPDRVLRRWERETGVDGIDPETMAAFFDRVERIQRVRTVPEEVLGKNARVFRRGVESLGLHGSPLRRAIEGCRGCGVCAFGCPSDAKMSTHLTYLPRAQRSGATIYANARATRILVETGRARGIEAELLDPATRAPKATVTVRAKVVVIAAGAVHTPALLARNAIGNASGQLGRNLRIHPAASVAGYFSEVVRGWEGTLQSYYVDDWHESDDIMIEVTSSVPSVGTGAIPGTGARFKKALGEYPHMATAGLFVSDTSSGRVVRRSDGEPAIWYSLNRRDTTHMVKGILRTAQVLLAAGARAVHTGIRGIDMITSPAQLEEVAAAAIKSNRLRPSAFHPVGTARLGVDPATSVVGPYGEVHGVPGLFVADAAVLPGCPTVNPMITIMGFATRTADHIARRGAQYF